MNVQFPCPRLRAMLVVTLALQFATGCSKISTPAIAVRDRLQTAQPTPHEWYIFVAQSLPTTVQKDLTNETQRLVSTAAQPGDVVHVIQTPAHRPLANLIVPKGSPKVRLRNPTVRAEMRRIAEALKRGDDASESRAAEQMQIPMVSSTIQSLRTTDFPAHVILVGNPVYDDEIQRGWSMAGGYVPTDASLQSPTSPFYDVPDFRPETTVSWLTPSTDWGVDRNHREAVVRFYRLFFQGNGASLGRVTVDAGAAFALDGSQFTDSVAPSNSDGPGVRRVTVRSERLALKTEPQTVKVDVALEPELQPHPVPTAEIQQLIHRAESSGDHIILAINWVSLDPHCDVDMWISNRGSHEELYFGNAQTPFGTLYRDIRQSGAIDENGNDFSNWECARINHNQLEDLTLWINVHNTNAPVTIRLVGVCRGQRKEKMFEMNITKGDQSKDHPNRETSSAWHRVGLTPTRSDL